MSSPTFDSHKIFDSVRADATTYSEGVLWVPSYTGIRQKLHFNGEDGDRYLAHGYPDRPWIFKGVIAAPSLAGLKTLLVAIETAIDLSVDDPTVTKALVDSFGNYYTEAQITSLHIVEITTTGDGYLAHIQVEGIVSFRQACLT